MIVHSDTTSFWTHVDPHNITLLRYTVIKIVPFYLFFFGIEHNFLNQWITFKKKHAISENYIKKHAFSANYIKKHAFSTNYIRKHAFFKMLMQSIEILFFNKSRSNLSRFPYNKNNARKISCAWTVELKRWRNVFWFLSWAKRRSYTEPWHTVF